MIAGFADSQAPAWESIMIPDKISGNKFIFYP
jgi:hypothetical protein